MPERCIKGSDARGLRRDVSPELSGSSWTEPRHLEDEEALCLHECEACATRYLLGQNRVTNRSIHFQIEPAGP